MYDWAAPHGDLPKILELGLICLVSSQFWGQYFEDRILSLLGMKMSDAGLTIYGHTYMNFTCTHVNTQMVCGMSCTHFRLCSNETSVLEHVLSSHSV